jgi:hypothetical protein
MVFAQNARAMHAHGLAILPISRSRQPLVRGFGRWEKRPSLRAIQAWAKAHPDSNIAVHPGQSGVIVVDVDDMSQDGEVERLFGDTPIKVTTRRGIHRYYRAPDTPVPGNLRAAGLNVDLKAGSAIVIAPPSIHESGHVYALQGDWSDLRNLPPLPRNWLDRFERKDPPRGALRMRDNSRGQWLNDQLCGRAAECGSLDDLLAQAAQLNHRLRANGYVPLEEEEVLKRAKEVWRAVQEGKLKCAPSFRGTVSTTLQEIEGLAALSRRHGSDAVVLLLKLRQMHAKRCEAGGTFCITPRAMADNAVLPGWTKPRYELARDVLLTSGLVQKVQSFRKSGASRKAAQYFLPEFGPEPKKPRSALGGGGN